MTDQPEQPPRQPYPYQPPSGPQPPQYGHQGYPPPGYGQPPPQPPKKSNTGLIVLAVIGGICLVLFAGCAALIALSSGNTPEVVTATAPAATAAAEPQTEVTDQGQGQADKQPAQVGGTLSLKGFENVQVDVTVTKVELKATPANEFMKPKAGNRFVAVQLQLANKGQATYQDSPSNGALVIDDQGQQYRSTFGEVKEGQAFQGSVTMGPGDSRKGVIVFEVPDGAKLAKFQFALNSGFADQAGEWMLGQ